VFVAGVDGCRAGWTALKVELPSRITSVEVIDLPALLRKRPPELALLGIDIPIGLLDGPRACDKAARKPLGPRRSSVFPARCRASLRANSHEEASAVNRKKTGKRSESAIVPHRTENKASGRRPYAELAAMGIRGSPRCLLLGSQRRAPCGA
jgi:predicted RNase H-like nuclease